MIITTEYERQRFEHLVLERPRPLPEIGPKPQGMSKAEWRVMKADLRARGAELLPGIEERVQLQEIHGGKKGTVETIAQLEERQRRPGSIARLYASRAIDIEQLAAAAARAFAIADTTMTNATIAQAYVGGSYTGTQNMYGRLYGWVISNVTLDPTTTLFRVERQLADAAGLIL